MRLETYPLLFCSFCVGLSLLFSGCTSAPSIQPTNSPDILKFKQGGVSIQYPKVCFETAKLEILPKKTQSQNAMPFMIGPKRWAISFQHAPRSASPRLSKPTYSHVYVTPLKDYSVIDFGRAYFDLNRNAKAFHAIFDGQYKEFSPWLVMWNRPPVSTDLPDEPWINAGQGLRAKFQVLDSPRIHGFRLLTYYAQGTTGYGATNEELLYNFQGITKDGKYYVSARISIHNPSLPNSPSDPQAASENTEKEIVAEQRRVNSWDDDTFCPNLNELDRMIYSLEIDR